MRAAVPSEAGRCRRRLREVLCRLAGRGSRRVRRGERAFLGEASVWHLKSMSRGVTYDEGGRRRWNRAVYASEYHDGEWAGRDEAARGATREESLRQLAKPAGGTLTKRETGLFCTVCNRNFKDSANFLTHINSPEHIAKAGIEACHRVATVDDVRTRLGLLKAQKAERSETAEEKRAKLEAWRASRKERKREWRERKRTEALSRGAE